MSDQAAESKPLPAAVEDALDINTLAHELGEGWGWTPTDVKQIEALRTFAATLTKSDACKAAGISRTRFDNWLRDDPGFQRVYQNILDAWVDEAELTTLRAGLDVERVADRHFILRTLRRSKYAEKQVIEVVSSDVQNRLQRQADAIVQLCQMELPEPYKSTFAAKMAEKLREIWS